MYQPMAACWDNGVLYVKNKYDFKNLSACTFDWEVTADGAVTANGAFKLEAKGHEMVTMPLELTIPESQYGAYLRVSMKDA